MYLRTYASRTQLPQFICSWRRYPALSLGRAGKDGKLKTLYP